MMNKKWLAIQLFLSVLLSGFVPEPVYNVEVVIENIKSDEGQLVIAVFDSKENYLKKEFDKKIIRVHEEKMVIRLQLPIGEYAVAVFHDLNDNKELDKNALGIPKEGFGFSNVSLGVFGPPSYEATKFEHIDNSTKVNVTLKHF